MGMEFKQHFDARTLGRDHLANYDHGIDSAKGGKAAGSILDIDPRSDGIFYKVQFTDVALQEIKSGEWKYLSPEYDDFYFDPETGNTFENVPIDLALTNTPFFKGMPSLNFSEIFTEDQPDKSKEDSKVDETLKKFAEKLGLTITDETTEEQILKFAEDMHKTIKPLQDTRREHEASRTFREAFPDQWDKIQKLEAAAIETDAREFSESYARFTVKDGDQNEYKSVLGFSTVVQEKIADVHKKFSQHEARHGDLKELLDLIGDKGIVDYSERGSNRSESRHEFSEDPRLAFSEAVADVMKKDELEYEAAMHVAATKYPTLYDNYLKAIPQR